MSLGILPFSLQLPAGYSYTPSGSGGTSSSESGGSGSVDVVSISDAALAGNLTAAAGDTFRMRDLFHASTADGKAIAGFRVALGDGGETGGGQLLLNGEDVTGQTDFTADEFANLTYVTGNGGSQSLTVLAQTGDRGEDGKLTQEIDSQAVQITASVTGSRSINAMNALATTLDGADADIASLAKQAAVLVGWAGASRPTLQTDGNFTAADGDTFRMRDLFHASTADGKAIAGFRVALGDGGETGGGQLLLNGEDVTGQTDFTADEFANLTYVTGKGGSQSLTVLAQTGDRGEDGKLTQEIDSQAVQITASVTGSRSINAMNALATTLDGADADIASLAKQAAVLVGWAGASRPTLQTALTPDPPSLASDIGATSGAYRSAGGTAPGQDIDLASVDHSAVGNSVSAAAFAKPSDSLAALLLLDGAFAGGYRTAGDLNMQALAIRAYNATSTL